MELVVVHAASNAACPARSTFVKTIISERQLTIKTAFGMPRGLVETLPSLLDDAVDVEPADGKLADMLVSWSRRRKHEEEMPCIRSY